MVKELQPWTVEVDKVGKKLVGETEVFLNGSCASNECNLGDFIADAMVDYVISQFNISID